MDVPTARERDQRLLKAIRDGDVGAFEQLYQRFACGLMGFILQRAPNQAEAEELLQETFLRMLKDRRFQPTRASLGTYLYIIARNLCLSHLRDQGSRRFESIDDIFAPQSPPMWGRPAIDPDEQVRQQRQLRALEGALPLLPERQREAFLLRHHHGFSYHEIAEICDCPVGTAKSRVHLAITALRVALHPPRENVTPLYEARDSG